MPVSEKTITKADKIGIAEIQYNEGDFRESPSYNITFFRNGKKYVEWFSHPESAEILMDLLGIEKDCR